MTLLEMIQKENAAAFTHGGKFHADDVFSAALAPLFGVLTKFGSFQPEAYDSARKPCAGGVCRDCF